MARRSARITGRRGNNGGSSEGQPSAQPNEQPNNQINAQLAALVNQAVNQALPQLVAHVFQAIQQPPENPEQANPGINGSHVNGDEGNAVGLDQPVVPMYVWLERFQKQKPRSFSSAPTPIDAENWMAHLEKIFDVLGCSDNHKVLLAAYKLEGDAQRWWKTMKITKGDGYAETLSWAEFCEVFYQQYFPAADKEAYGREYLSIRQKDDESIMDFMTRFIRLAGFAGTSAGTTAEQAEKFKWRIHYKYRQHLINNKFADVSAVANAAKNIEMERQDFRSSKPEGNRKRDRDDQQGQASGQHGRNQGGQWNRNRGGQQGQWRGQNQNRGYQQLPQQGQNRQLQLPQQGQNRQQWQNRQQGQNQGRYPGPANRGNPNLIPIVPCATCGGNHPGRQCHRVSGACFLCGQMGHIARDCTGPRGNGGGSNNGNNAGQRQGGRVFAMTYNQAAGAPGNQGDQGQV